MRSLLPIFTLMVLMFSFAPLAAQDAPDAGWPVERRCVGDPTEPPDGWTFDGTILITGYAGIHAARDEWETPHVVARVDLPGGALSPDGRWYAAPYGDTYVTETYNQITTVYVIRVQSTSDDKEEYQVELKNGEHIGVFYGGTYGTVYWLNHELFLYENLMEGVVVVNPFAGSIIPWEMPVDADIWISSTFPLHFAPDWTRLVFYAAIKDGWHLYDLTHKRFLAELQLTDYPIVQWQPDSTRFIASVGDDNNPDLPGKLVLFDRDANPLETVFVPEQSQQFASTSATWSDDGHYLTFNTFPLTVYNGKAYFYQYKYPNILYIADTGSKRIINTCLSISQGVAWSPDSELLAFLTPEASSDGLKQILVLDTSTWNLYRVAYQIQGHDDQVIGWRGD